MQNRLRETLDVVTALWSGEPVDFEGQFHHLAQGQQRPTPLADIPIVIGGAGPRTLELVAAHATWWNCPIYALDRFDEASTSSRAGRRSTTCATSCPETCSMPAASTSPSSTGSIRGRWHRSANCSSVIPMP